MENPHPERRATDLEPDKHLEALEDIGQEIIRLKAIENVAVKLYAVYCSTRLQDDEICTLIHEFSGYLKN